MSLLGSRTRKVTTYGKKRTGIVSLYTDDKLLTPNRNERDQENVINNSITAIESPTRVKRAPLKSKQSSDNINLPTLSSNTSRRGNKGSKLPDFEDEEGFFVDQSIKAKPKARASTKAGKSLKKKERFDGVELQASQTKSTPRRSTILEITEDMTQISITEEEPSTNHQADFERLVQTATPPAIQDFTAFLSSPAVLSLLDPRQQGSGLKIRKIGEASYSEVFAVTIKEEKEIVVKVIPLYDPDTTPITTMPIEPGTRGSHPDTSAPGDVLRELEITKRMCELPGGGFIDFLGSYIAKGKYPQALLDEWWSFKTTFGSASVCPDKFGDDQQYALVILADGGLDLETFKFDSESGWKQAAGVFWQTTDALARAEKWTSFEHRDLHEGQILVTAIQSSSCTASSPINYLSPCSSGARATIIDFGLSRLSLPEAKSSTWSAFPAEVYEGKGDQWDVYRSMRDTVEGDWSSFHPRTNVLWLQYLLRYLLHRTKSLRRPKTQTKQRSRRVRAPRKSDLVDEGVMTAYTCLTQTEQHLSQGGDDIRSAQELMAWGKASGFSL